VPWGGAIPNPPTSSSSAPMYLEKPSELHHSLVAGSLAGDLIWERYSSINYQILLYLTIRILNQRYITKSSIVIASESKSLFTRDSSRVGHCYSRCHKRSYMRLRYPISRQSLQDGSIGLPVFFERSSQGAHAASVFYMWQCMTLWHHTRRRDPLRNPVQKPHKDGNTTSAIATLQFDGACWLLMRTCPKWFAALKSALISSCRA